MRYNNIIFDLDGTLLNTLYDLKESTNFALHKYGYPERTIEEVRMFVGNGVAKLIERALPDGCENPDYESCLRDFKADYKIRMYEHTKPYDGILEMLEKIQYAGIKAAVVSNKFDAAVKELCKRYFGKRISVAIGESENVRKKPAPDSVFRAMELLGADKEKTVYCGDSDVDVETAKNSGLSCIGVSWGFRDRKLLEQMGADYIVDSAYELLSLLLNK